MNEAELLAWCVPLVFLALSLVFFVVGGIVRGGRDWSAAFVLVATGFAISIVDAGDFAIIKAVVEDGFWICGVAAMTRGISLRFRRDPYDRSVLFVGCVTLAMVAIVLLAGHNVTLEIALVQCCCTGFALLAAFQMRGRLGKAINKTLFGLTLGLSITLATHTVLLFAVPEPALTLQGWRGTDYAFLFQLSSVAFGLGFAFTALIAIGLDAVDHQRHSSETDILSGILNRRGFTAHIENFQRVTAREGTLILMDLDHFKQVNDIHGHFAGDMVIAGLGTLLDELCDGKSFAGRLGGEEFAVFIGDGDQGDAIRFAQRVRSTLALIDWPAPLKTIAITASFGIGCFPKDERFEAVYRRADDRLYLAKAAGRDRIVSAWGEVGEATADTDAIAASRRPVMDTAAREPPLRLVSEAA